MEWMYYIFFCKCFLWKKNYSIWCGIFICTYMIFHIQVWLEILASFWDGGVVIFYSQMQELRTTFFWLLIANHLGLFKQILQTTYLLQIYIHCWLNSVFKIKLALFNFKIPSSDKIQLCWVFFLFFREFHSNKNTSVFHFDSCLPFKWWHKSIKNGRVLKLFLFCFIKLCTYTYSKKTILQLDVIRDWSLL